MKINIQIIPNSLFLCCFVTKCWKKSGEAENMPSILTEGIVWNPLSTDFFYEFDLHDKKI